VFFGLHTVFASYLLCNVFHLLYSFLEGPWLVTQSMTIFNLHALNGEYQTTKPHSTTLQKAII